MLSVLNLVAEFGEVVLHRSKMAHAVKPAPPARSG